MKKATVRRFGAVLVGLSLVAGACGSDEEAVTEETEAVTEETEAPAAETVPGSELKGMKGTTPLVELSDDFKTGINEFWTGKGNEALTDFNYAGESFDAVMLIALAAEAAKSDGSEMPTRSSRCPRTARSAPRGRTARRSSRPAPTWTSTASRAPTP